MTQRGSVQTILGSMGYSWCQCQYNPVDINVGKLTVSGGHWGSAGVIGNQLEYPWASLEVIGVHWGGHWGSVGAQW